jgi:hypothetical protein
MITAGTSASLPEGWGRALYAIDTLEERITGMVRQLPLRGPDGKYLVDDEALRTTTISAQAASKAFWRLACAARAEIARRLAERVPDPATLRREIAREAAEQHISTRTFRRDAQIGEVFGPLFAEPDSAPDLGREYYEIARTAVDPQAALLLAARRKDEDPLYSTSDFEADLARARISDPLTSYGPTAEGRSGLAFLWPYWDQGVVETAEKAIALPLRRWLLPDAIILLRLPPRALDLGMRLLNAHSIQYRQTVFLPTPPFRDGDFWHEQELLLCGTIGKLRPPEGIPGTWRNPLMQAVELYFPFAHPRLVIYPRHGMEITGWKLVEDLPEHMR